jgi:hypothetical protein
MTSGCSGKSFADWALPGDAGPYTGAVRVGGRLDYAVMDGVETRLHTKMSELFPGEMWTRSSREPEYEFDAKFLENRRPFLNVDRRRPLGEVDGHGDDPNDSTSL